jgi:hypothetical protein
MHAAPTVFYSYSSKDERLGQELEAHHSSLRRQGLISTWSFRRIQPGEKWDQAIHQSLDKATVILLLVSSDFLNSDYCWNVEVERALARQKTNSQQTVSLFKTIIVHF